MLGYKDIVDAHQRISGRVYRSPCVPSETLSRLCSAPNLVKTRPSTGNWFV